MKATQEMLNDFLSQDTTPCGIKIKSDEKQTLLEKLITDYECHWTQDNSPKKENSLNLEEKEITPKLDERKMILRQIYSMLRDEEDYSDDILRRVISICMKNKRVIELLQILINKEKDLLILQMITEIKPQEESDYEDCLFVLAEYFTDEKMETLFKWLKYSVDYETYSIYPLFSLSLRKLIKIKQFEEATLLLNYLMHYGIEISTCAINLFIETFTRHDRIEEAQGFFNKFLHYNSTKKFPEEIQTQCKFNKLIINSGVNIVTYGTLIRSLCRTYHLDLAFHYYDLLKQQNLIEDEIIFNLLIDGCSKASNMEMLRSVYFDMLTMNITPTTVTFNTIIDAYIRMKDIESAWKIYDDILHRGINTDNFTLSILFRGIRQKSHRNYLLRAFDIIYGLREKESDIILINVLLDSCISMREEILLVDLFEKVSFNHLPSVKKDIITFNTFIKGCAQMGLYDKAYEAYEMMFQQNEVIPNDVFFNTMIDVCVRSQNMSKVWSIINKMQEVGIKPDNFTYSTIIKGISKHSNLNHSEENDSTDPNDELNLAFKLFDNVKKFTRPDEILYNCIMDACLRFNKTEKMLELYDEMLDEKIKPSSITCGIIIKAYGMKGKLEKALEVYQDMKRNYTQISPVTYGCLINACIKNDNLQKAFELYEEINQNKVEMNTILYTTLIKAYSRKNEIRKVLEIFNKMKMDNKNPPNNITFNSVIDCCVKCEDIKLAEKIFDEMQKSNIRPDIITFSTLIKGCLKKSELNKAIDYLNLMQTFNIKPDEVLLNSLLDGCEKMNKFHKAIEIFNHHRSFNVEPAMMSYSIMMKVYGKLNEFESSKKLMEEVKRKLKNVSLIIFTCYMKTCINTGHIEEAINIYQQLKQFKLTPDSITYSTLLNGLILHNKVDNDAIKIIEESLEDNIMLSKRIYYEVAKRLSQQTEMKEESKAFVELLASYDIQINLSNRKNETGNTFIKKNNVNSHNEEKSGGNMNFLINSYKHKTSTNTKTPYNNVKTAYSTNSSSTTPLNQLAESFNKFTNLSTADTLKKPFNFNDENENVNNNQNLRINLDTRVKLQDLTVKNLNNKFFSNMERPKFVNSKKEFIHSGNDLISPYATDSTPIQSKSQWKSTTTTNNKKFTRF